MEIDEKIVDSHCQLYPNSCIPSAVEIILKLLRKVNVDYYELQKEWNNRSDGSFRDFDGRKIANVTFSLVNGLSFEELFIKIDQELKGMKFVIVSLKTSPQNFHMYVIYRKNNDDYDAVTKKFPGHETEKINNVKKRIKCIGTTDLLVYSM